MRKLLDPTRFWLRLTLAGAVLAAFETWQIARPSLWADEVATIAAANRSLGQTLHLLYTIDAVHGTYYLLIHFIGGVFGYSPLVLRLPSALAVAGTAIVVSLIAKRISGERLAWFALILTAILPRLMWAATEARSYGIDAFLTALMVWLFLNVIEDVANPNCTAKRKHLDWVAYTFVVVLDTHFFIYSILVAGSQGLWLLWDRRQIFKHWLLSLGIAVVTSGFLICWVLIEQGQVGWLPQLSQTTLEEIFVGQAFWENQTLAFIANGLIIAVLAGAVHPRSQQVLAKQQVPTSYLRLLGIIVLFPPALILLYSLLRNPIYDSRYFTMTAPMVSLLLAIAADRLFSRRLAVIAVVLIATLALPTYFKFRATDAKGTHWESVAVTLNRLEQPGDGVLFTDFDRKSPSQSRIMIGYRPLVSDLTDLTVVSPYQRANGLYPKRETVEQAVGKLQGIRRVLVVQESAERTEYLRVKTVLTNAGFGFARRVRVAHTWVNIFSK